jgi:hypothetical protein
MGDAWPQSKTAILGATGMNPQSKISDAEVQAIANMMDEAPEATSESGLPTYQPITHEISLDVGPEAAAKLMIQNYIKQNGSVIIDDTPITDDDTPKNLILG